MHQLHYNHPSRHDLQSTNQHNRMTTARTSEQYSVLPKPSAPINDRPTIRRTHANQHNIMQHHASNARTQ